MSDINKQLSTDITQKEMKKSQGPVGEKQFRKQLKNLKKLYLGATQAMKQLQVLSRFHILYI